MAKNVQLDAKGYRKFGMRDNLAYAAGDFGCNMSFALKGTMAKPAPDKRHRPERAVQAGAFSSQYPSAGPSGTGQAFLFSSCNHSSRAAGII